MFTNGRPNKIGERIAQHNNQKDRKDPLPSLRNFPQQSQMAEQEGEIKETKENRGTVPGDSLNRAVIEKKEGRNKERRNDKGAKGKPLLQIKTGDQSGTDRRRKVVFKAANGRKGHAIKFIKGDKDGDGHGSAEERRGGAPYQQEQEREEDDRGKYSLFNDKAP